ncbi:RDD family protein [Bacillus sp. AFS055030]|uniref:RDD family protein n=1 Tax=Bacillus sp. AFS055030 TaxID=2033507 RepID=UPI000BFB6854|nr:RDD family protein [Bacillus sp. AFS055030]PGL70875.1 transporter [Bacillus sp. AFS055030]
MENRQKILTSFRLKRIGAFAIDAIIVSIILSIVYRITGLPNFPGVLANMIELQKSTASQDATVKVMALFNEAFLQSLIIYFCYEVATTLLLRGSTIGKMIFRLKLTRINNNKGKLPYIFLVIVRSFFKFLTMFIFQGIPFFLSVISMFANQKSLAVHDRIGRFVVMNKKEA